MLNSLSNVMFAVCNQLALTSLISRSYARQVTELQECNQRCSMIIIRKIKCLIGEKCETQVMYLKDHLLRIVHTKQLFSFI